MDRTVVNIKRWFCFLVLVVFPYSPTLAFQEKESDRPTVRAVQDCVVRIQDMLALPSARGDDLECSIPVVVDEEELDLILAQAFDIKKLAKYREKFASLSSSVTKGMINARSATCQMTISMPRAKVLAVIQNADYHTTFSAQPVTCLVKTGSGEAERISFSFRPELNVKDRCVNKFYPHMGEVKTPCKVCWPVNMSRLYLTTSLVSLWVNHIGKNFTAVMNQILYRKCPS